MTYPKYIVTGLPRFFCKQPVGRGFLWLCVILTTLVACEDPAKVMGQENGNLPWPRQLGEKDNKGKRQQTSNPTVTEVELVALAIDANPKIRQLQALVRAAYDKVPQVRSLPDPTVGVNFFIHPIETASGSQRAILTITQKFPWFGKLNALGKQAALRAGALEQNLAGEIVTLRAQVRSSLYSLYKVEQQVRINKVNQKLLEKLTKVALARVRVGRAGQGDVLRATLELSRLKADLANLEQQQISFQARLNELLNRPPSASAPVPDTLNPRFDESWNYEALWQVAWTHQPALVAAKFKQDAEHLGIRIAELEQIPEVMLGASTFFTEDNRPATNVVDVGQDPWSIGVSVNIPLYRDRYQAMQREAKNRFHAARWNFDATLRHYERQITHALAEVKAARQIVQYFDDSILPQARQTLSADTEAYQLGKVEFDRVIEDFRNLIQAEVGYHNSLARYATAIAQLEQFVGVSLQSIPPPRASQGKPDNGNTLLRE